MYGNGLGIPGYEVPGYQPYSAPEYDLNIEGLSQLGPSVRPSPRAATGGGGGGGGGGGAPSAGGGRAWYDPRRLVDPIVNKGKAVMQPLTSRLPQGVKGAVTGVAGKGARLVGGAAKALGPLHLVLGVGGGILNAGQRVMAGEGLPRAVLAAAGDTANYMAFGVPGTIGSMMTGGAPGSFGDAIADSILGQDPVKAAEKSARAAQAKYQDAMRRGDSIGAAMAEREFNQSYAELNKSMANKSAQGGVSGGANEIASSALGVSGTGGNADAASILNNRGKSYEEQRLMETMRLGQLQNQFTANMLADPRQNMAHPDSPLQMALLRRQMALQDDNERRLRNARRFGETQSFINNNYSTGMEMTKSALNKHLDMMTNALADQNRAALTQY